MVDKQLSKEEANPDHRIGFRNELDCKLEYLIKQRGDRRKGVAFKRPTVSSQETLAQHLGINNSTVGRWREAGTIPSLAVHAQTIASTFDCDEQSFKNDDCNTFKAKCGANTVSWGRLLSRAKPDLSAVQPVPKPPIVRAAGLEHRLEHLDQLTIVRPGQAFTVELPGDGNGWAPTHWAEWHVLMFCGDRGGYLNWLPSYGGTHEFGGMDRFPKASRRIAVPRGGGQQLIAHKTASGEHDVVAIVSRDSISKELRGELMKPLRNAELQPILDQLAAWVMPRLDIEPEPEAAILRGLFFVGHHETQTARLEEQ